MSRGLGLFALMALASASHGRSVRREDDEHPPEPDPDAERRREVTERFEAEERREAASAERLHRAAAKRARRAAKRGAP